MKVTVVSVGVVVAVLGLSGCTDLTPIQNQIKDLSSQVSRLSTEEAGMKSTLRGPPGGSRCRGCSQPCCQ